MRRTLIGLVLGIIIGITVVNMSGVGKAAETEGSSENPLTSWIPDLKEIMGDSLRDIFNSASTEINDPAIADFYGKLTTNMMVTVEEGNTGGYTGPEIAFPLIRFATPAHDSTVSGSVFVWVDAIDDFDAPGSLSVVILIDGAAPIMASYSPVSGYYEAIWDSSTVLPGTMHTLTATATDSVGNSQATLIALLVE